MEKMKVLKSWLDDERETLRQKQLKSNDKLKALVYRLDNEFLDPFLKSLNL